MEIPYFENKIEKIEEENHVALKFQNGMLIQYGIINNSEDGYIVLHFLESFINDKFNIQLTNRYFPGGQTPSTQVLLTVHYNTHGNGVGIYFRRPSGEPINDSQYSANYFAIGRWK